MREIRVPVDTGLTLHALEWDESKASHSLILVHGFLDICWGWRATVDAGLAEHFHVVAPDMRGHGDSDRVGAGGYYYFMDYVADLLSLIDRLGRERVSLVGHSMGGNIVSYATGTRPERISQLALLEGMGPPEDPTPLPERTAGWVESVRRVRARSNAGYASIEEAARRLQKTDDLLDSELALELARHGTIEGEDGRFRFKHDPLHLTRGPYPFRVEVAESFWRRIQCPVLLVSGKQSSFASLSSDYAARADCLSDARSVELDGAGHMLQRHVPAALCEVLLRFLLPRS